MQPLPDGRGRSVRVLGALVALLVLLAVVALASRSGFGRTSGTTTTPGYVNWAMSVFLVLFALMIPFALYAYTIQMREFRAQNQRSMQARVARSLGVMFLVLGVVSVATYLRAHSHFFDRHPILPSPMTSLARRAAHPGGADAYHPTFQYPVLWVALVLAGVAAAWYLRARARRGELAVVAAPTVAEDVAQSLDDAIDDLLAEADARRAVIAAYARMERVFDRHGLHRRASETPAEYLRRLLLGLTTRVEAVRRLTALFEQARFSDHAIDAAMKQDAVDSLRAIRDDLQAAAP